MISSVTVPLTYCLRRNCFRLAGLTASDLKRRFSQLNTTKTNEEIGGLDCRENGEALTIYHQHSFESFGKLVEDGKRDAKNYILVEDKTGKLVLENRQSLEMILDSPVSDYWDYWISNRHYFLVKLVDHSEFRKKIPTLPSESKLPLYSKSYSITNLPNGKGSSLSLLHSSTTSRAIKDILLERNKAKSYKNLTTTGKLEDSMRLLVNSLAMNDLERKLRFFVIDQLEQLLCDGVFGAFQFIPYGSSFNGLGWGESALDLCLTPACDFQPNGNIVFQSDAYNTNKRTRFIQAYQTMMKENLLPGVRNPKVPYNHFIKFFSTSLFTDVTITCCNPEDSMLIEVAEIIYNITRSDERILYLMHYCKLWAKVQGVTNLTLNNFLLTMLIINYLQTRRPFPILPPMNALLTNNIDLEGRRKKLILEQKESFSDILIDFFHHITTFEFANNGFSPLKGKSVNKRVGDPLYIEDTATAKNMASKVTVHDLRNLCDKAKKSYKILGSGEHPSKLLEPLK